ncbi:hypothetical protein DFJ73DRAFT_565874 [Zopfochytrium polystomum]|nr:hypothetical protein DFJ73DRAFT_565874 [Zopfochytrium polystomum]
MLQQQHLELMGGPSLGNHSVPTSRPIQPQELLRDAPGASRQPILPVSTVPPSSRYPRATARSQPQIVPLVPSLDVSRKPRSTVSPRSTHGMMVQPQPTPPGAGPYMNAPGPYLWQEASSLSSTQTPSSQYQQQYFQQGSQPYPHHQAYQNSPSAPGAPLSPPLGGPPVASTPPPVAGSPSRRSGNSLDVSGLSLNPSKTPPTVSPPINPLNVIGNRPQPLPPPIPNSGSTTPVQQSIAYSLAQGSPPALPQAPIALNPLAAMALIPIALLKEQQQPGIAPNPIPLQGPTGLRFPQSEVPSSSGAPIPNDGGKGAAPISTAAVSAGVSKTKATGTLSAPSAYSLALSTGKKKR